MPRRSSTSDGKLKFILFDGTTPDLEALEDCSLAAQGLYFRLIGPMMRSPQVGTLMRQGRPMTTDELARKLEKDPEEVAALIAELEAAKVLTRTPNSSALKLKWIQAYFAEMKKKQRSGAKGGNPSLRNSSENPPPVNRKVNRGDNQDVNPEDNLRVLESRSRSPLTPQRDRPPDVPGHTPDTEPETRCDVWQVELRKSLGVRDHSVWFQGVKLVYLEEDTAVLEAPTRCTADQIKQRYEADLRRALSAQFGRSLRFIEVLSRGDPALSAHAELNRLRVVG